MKVVQVRTPTLGSDRARSMGPLECVMFLVLQSADVETWGEWAVGGRLCSWMRPGLPCQADATSEVATVERVKGEDLIGELLKSLYGTRRPAHKC